MATYALSGSGVQALSASVTALHVTITTPATTQGNGRANPTDTYGAALLRFGDAVGYFEPQTVAGGPQWMAVPNGCTRIGYACLDGSALSVVEVIGGTPPFGGAGASALSALSDVQLASLADAQVLTYQASSSKWINATPTGGGGSSSSPIKYAETVLSSAAASVTFSSIPNTYRNIRLTWQGRSDASTTDTALLLQFNGDTGNNYDWQELYTSGTGVGAGNTMGTSSLRVGRLSAATSTNAAMAPVGQSTIPNYANTTWWQGVVSTAQQMWDTIAGALAVYSTVGNWRNTAAINSLLLKPAAGNFTTNSVFTLYLEP